MCSRCTQRDIATAFDFITILFASGGLGTRLGSECRAPVGTVDFRHQLRGECEWLGYEGGRTHDSVLVRYGLLRNIRSYPCIVVTAAPCCRAECLAPTSPISADIGNRGESIFLSRTILQRHDSTWWKPDVLDVTSFDVRATLPRSAASRRTSQSCPPRQRWLSNTSCLWPSCGSRPARRRIPCRGCYCETPSKSHRLRADCRHSA